MRPELLGHEAQNQHFRIVVGREIPYGFAPISDAFREKRTCALCENADVFRLEMQSPAGMSQQGLWDWVTLRWPVHEFGSWTRNGGSGGRQRTSSIQFNSTVNLLILPSKRNGRRS